MLLSFTTAPLIAAAVGSCTEPVTVPLVTWPIAVALKMLSTEKKAKRTARFRPAEGFNIVCLSYSRFEPAECEPQGQSEGIVQQVREFAKPICRDCRQARRGFVQIRFSVRAASLITARSNRATLVLENGFAGTTNWCPIGQTPPQSV